MAGLNYDPRIVEQFPGEADVIVAGPFEDHLEAVRTFRLMRGDRNRRLCLVYPALPICEPDEGYRWPV